MSLPSNLQSSFAVSTRRFAARLLLATVVVAPVSAFAEGVRANDVAPVGKSRADVIAELEAWRKNPVTHDGWRYQTDEHLVYVGTPGARTADKSMADAAPAAARKKAAAPAAGSMGVRSTGVRSPMFQNLFNGQ